MVLAWAIGLASCYLMFKFSYRWLDYFGIESFIKFDEPKYDSDGYEIEGYTPNGISLMNYAEICLSIKLGMVAYERRVSFLGNNSETLKLDIAILFLIITSIIHIVIIDGISSNILNLIFSLATVGSIGYGAFRFYHWKLYRPRTGDNLEKTEK